MPYKPLKPCRYPGCGALTAERYCDKHKPERAPDNRATANSRGYNARWRRARKMFLAEHPLCAECEKNGRLTAATVVDHIIPHKGDQALFWDESNWQPLCKRCHDRKTVREDGGFGNKIKIYGRCEGEG